MPDSIAQDVLRVLASRKGAPIDELFASIPHPMSWSNTDDPRPVHLMLPALTKLTDWGLVEPYLDSEVIAF